MCLSSTPCLKPPVRFLAVGKPGLHSRTCNIISPSIWFAQQLSDTSVQVKVEFMFEKTTQKKHKKNLHMLKLHPVWDILTWPKSPSWLRVIVTVLFEMIKQRRNKDDKIAWCGPSLYIAQIVSMLSRLPHLLNSHRTHLSSAWAPSHSGKLKGQF